MAELEVLIDGKGAVRGSEVVIRSLENIRAKTGQADDQQRRFNKTLKQGSGAAQLFKRALAGIGIGIVVQQFTSLSDSFTEITNKVKIATAETGGLAATTEELFNIAQRTRAPIDSITTLYQRASLAAKELGVSQRDLLKFTESIGQALAIQGGSAASASGSLLQLSQALGSGIVRAEEFNSILEGAFPIALAAANGLDAAGGSVAKLRTLITEGKVTSKDFFAAIQRSAPELEDTFSKTTITISQSFTLLRNSLVQSVGDFNKSTGAAQIFAKAIQFVALNLDNLARSAAVVAIAFGPAGLTKAFNSAKGAVIALNLAIRANPIGALITVIAAAIGAITVFSDKIKIPGSEIVTLRDVFVATFNIIKKKWDDVSGFFINAWNIAVGFVQEKLGAIPFTLTDVLLGIKSFANKVIGTFVGIARVVAFGFGKIPELFSSVFGDELPLILEDVGRSTVNFFKAVFGTVEQIAINTLEFVGASSKAIGDKLGAELDFEGIGLSVKDTFSGIGDEAADIFIEAYNRDYLAEIGAFLLPAISAISDEAARVAQERLDRLAAEAAAGGGISDEVPGGGQAYERAKELQDIIDETANPLEQLNAKLRELEGLQALAIKAGDAEALRAISIATAGAMEEFGTAIGAIDPTPVEQVERALADIAILQAQAAAQGDTNFLALLDQSAQNLEKSLINANLAAAGLGTLDEILFDSLPTAEQFDQLILPFQKLRDEGKLTEEQFEQVGKAIKEKLGQKIFDLAEIGKQAARNLQDAFADFLFDPFDEGIEGMLRGFADALRRMAAEALAQQIIQGLIGAFSGGFGGAFAGGGDFEGGKPILVGEQGPEIITPRQPGTVVPNNMIGGGQQASPTVNVAPTPVVVLDDPSKIGKALQSDPNTQRALVDAIATKKGSINQALS